MTISEDRLRNYFSQSVLTAADVADLLKITRAHVNHLTRSGKLHSFKKASSYWYTRQDVLDYTLSLYPSNHPVVETITLLRELFRNTPEADLIHSLRTVLVDQGVLTLLDEQHYISQRIQDNLS